MSLDKSSLYGLSMKIIIIQPEQSMASLFSKFSWASAFFSAGLQYKYGRHTMMRRFAYHSSGATPLLLAIICGNYEAAARLLYEGRKKAALGWGEITRKGGT